MRDLSVAVLLFPPWLSRSISHAQRTSTVIFILGPFLFAAADNDPASVVAQIIYRKGSKHIENAGPEAGRNSDERMKKRRNGGYKTSGVDGASWKRGGQRSDGG